MTITSPQAARPRKTVPRRPAHLLPGTLLLVPLLVLGTSCTGTQKTVSRDPIPGAAGIGDPLFPKLGNGGYDVTHYRLTLDYTPRTHRLRGTARITARTTRALSSFHLDLAGLHVRDTTVNGRPARAARSGTELTLTPAAALPRNRTFTATVVYDGKPKTLKDPDGSREGWLRTSDGAVGLGEPTGSMTWFPSNNHPSDKAAYDITVTVPEGYTAVSNGELTRRDTHHGRTTHQWRARDPMATYLATVAIGRFGLHRTTADGLPQYVAIDPTEAKVSRDVPGQITKITAWERRTFGPYPFTSTGAIVDHLPDLGYALETQTRPYFAVAPDQRLIVHELAHQWFGDSVTPRTWKDMWLNEGFATYAEWLWTEQHHGRTAQQTFDDFYDGTDDESDGIWSFPPAAPPSPGRVSDPPVYGRGAMALHQLRRTVGDPAFFRILRTWLKDHRHGNADTRQFTALAERLSGKDLDKLFTTWLYAKAKPPRP
jgi:aminopeptidase N